MAAFAYEALDGRGRRRKGVQEADSPRQLRQQLRAAGLAPITIAPAVNAAPATARTPTRWRPRRVQAREVALITRQLATLVAAAIPIEECLHALARQQQKNHLRGMITAVRSRVLEGQSLSDSLAAFPRVFDRLYRAMVAAGEKSGHLDTVLVQLADYHEQRQQVHSKLIQALVYPAILTVVAISVIAALLVTVVPTVVEQFSQMGQELPAMTRALIALSDGVQQYGLYALLMLLGLLVIRQRMLTLPRWQLRHDRLLLRLPVLGATLAGVETARFARTLSVLTSSAIPVLEGMRIASGILANRHIRQELEGASERVREGASLWLTLEETRLFPPMMLHIIASGEKSGELQQMLRRAADVQDRQFEAQVNIALSVFAPLLIVLMAAMVLFIVMAILTPMLDLNSLVAG